MSIFWELAKRPDPEYWVRVRKVENIWWRKQLTEGFCSGCVVPKVGCIVVSNEEGDWLQLSSRCARLFIAKAETDSEARPWAAWSGMSAWAGCVHCLFVRFFDESPTIEGIVPIVPCPSSLNWLSRWWCGGSLVFVLVPVLQIEQSNFGLG